MNKILKSSRNQKGALPLLLLVGIVGLFIISAITTFAPFKDKLFSGLFSKKSIMAASAPDLDVTFISQSPKYNRYCVQMVSNLPQPCPGTENQKRFPNPGEVITHTAHIKNKGPVTFGNFDYKWFVDGLETSSSTFIGSLEPGAETTVTLQSPWTDQSKNIKFQILPPAGTDIYMQNNSLTFGTRDLTISYWVETGAYNLFNSTANVVGTYSFEDWIQAHIARINERFEQSKYPAVAPDGARDRVRIDKIVVADQLDIGGCAANPMSQDPDLFLIDGRWLTTDGSCDNSAGNNGGYQSYFNEYISKIDWGLVHEVSHQLGIIDLYRMGLKNNDSASPNRGVMVTNISGQIIPESDLDYPFFRNSGVMGGGDTAPYNNGTYFESHTAAGLNSHYQKRRGYYGEYLYDTPLSNSVQVLDNSGNPLPNTQISLYQKDANSEDVDDIPEFSDTTDSSGLVAILNRSVNGVTTLTGHTLRNNPFGPINVVGTNATMILKATKDDKEGYGFYLLHDLNLAYWSGQTSAATITIKTNYPKISLTPIPSPSPGANLALNKVVTASSTIVANGWHKDNAVDGKTNSTSTSMGWTSDSNLGVNHEEWIMINLGANIPVDQVKLYPRTDNPGLFFPIDFRIEASTDGTSFTTLTERQNFVNPGSSVQTFNFTPVQAKYIRLVATKLMMAEGSSFRIQLAEIEIFGIAIITPSPSSSPSQSPSPSPNKPGDIDGNNKVDIFDYNQLLTDFGKTGTNLISDIEKSGNSLNKVDIFDYNLVLTNFGR